MKKLLVALILLLAVAAAAQQYPPSGASTGRLAVGYPDGFGQHATLSNKLLAYWPLDEPTGALSFRDPFGGYTLRALQGSAITSVAGVPTTGQRFTRTSTVVADLVVTPSATQGQAVFTSASAALPVYATGDHFSMTSAFTSFVGRALTTGTASSVLVQRDGADDYAVTGGSGAGTFSPVNWLVRGYSALGGFGGYAPDYGRTQDSAIHLDGQLGFTLVMWIRIPTGAPTNKLYFFNGTHFGAQFAIGDQNSTQLSFSPQVYDYGAANATSASLPLPALDTWYFYVTYFDPATRTLTVNRNAGAGTNTGAALGGVGWPNIDFEFGAGHVEIAGSYRAFIWGGVDLHGIGLWNRVLTTAEISFLYNAGAGRVY